MPSSSGADVSFSSISKPELSCQTRMPLSWRHVQLAGRPGCCSSVRSFLEIRGSLIGPPMYPAAGGGDPAAGGGDRPTIRCTPTSTTSSSCAPSIESIQLHAQGVSAGWRGTRQSGHVAATAYAHRSPAKGSEGPTATSSGFSSQTSSPSCRCAVRPGCTQILCPNR